MPKRTNTQAHSYDKQTLRQLLALFGNDQASPLSTGDSLLVKFNLPETDPADTYFAGTRSYRMSVEDQHGNIHKWYNRVGAQITAVATTAGDGAVVSPVITVDIVAGEGVVEVEFTDTWASGDTLLLGFTGAYILGAPLPGASQPSGADRTITVA